MSEKNAAAAHRRVLLFVPNLIGYARLILLAVGVAAERWNPAVFFYLWLVSASLDLVDGIAARKLKQCSHFGEVLDVVADNVTRTLVWSMVARTARGTVETHLAPFFISVEWITFVSSHSLSIEARRHWKEEVGGDKIKSRDASVNKGVSASSSEGSRKPDENQDGIPAESEREATPPPYLLRKIFENNFKNVFGFTAIVSTFALPMILYLIALPDDVRQEGVVDPIGVFSLLLSLFPSSSLFHTLMFTTSSTPVPILTFLLCAYAVCGRVLAFLAEMWVMRTYVISLLDKDGRSS
uniref:CDP-diacylglycerol--inositol 3-phosphatidyltransferase n=1 Tax=Palpitomonas bilix TaxID=652834 RepID=A0A7S3G6Z0_9EUKA|mmetsp:Transcript_31747/g.82831  ORF Transcript_31747/g.82831 Transcript_31747/m.82831 type:complete len:296 (+) Transcript_31747:360-1247(+)